MSVEVSSHPERGVRSSQPEGIGRVAPLGDGCAWNNLGRNVVFASRTFEPLAIFGDTAYPDDDEASQYDLDVHAILAIPGTGVVVLNHLGLLGAFRAAELRGGAGPVPHLQPRWTRPFVADMERVVAVGRRLIGSRPRETRAGGVLVSEELSPAGGPERVDADVHLEPFGPVTALAALTLAGAECIALGGSGRVALVPVGDGQVGEPRWQVDVGFQPAAFLSDGGLLWVAGSDLAAAGVDDYDWERLHAGGFVGLQPADGRTVVTGRFEHDLAWGNGGCAVAMIAGVLCGIGRAGELHLYRTRDGRPIASTPPIATRSLGIAHAATVGDHLLFGWNRAGYRLHAVAASTIREQAGAHA